MVYENDKGNILKKLAAYHQYYAVNKAIVTTLKASSPAGDKRIGVVWPDGTEEIVQDPTAIPKGAWAVSVISFTGQTWTVPHELAGLLSAM